MENQEVADSIKAKQALLKNEMSRLPDAKVMYKWYLGGKLSKGCPEEVEPGSVDSFIDYWVGQGFYLEQNTQEMGSNSIIWLKIWEYGDPEPTWEEVFE